MLRFFWVNTFYFSISGFYIVSMWIMGKSKKKDRKSKYDYARKVVILATKKSRVSVDVSGLENLPEQDGYVLFANHQGKFDSMAVVGTHERILNIVVKKNRSNYPLVKQMLDLIGAKRLDTENLRASVHLFDEVAEEIQNGINYLIFPEGYYSDNKNNLQEFHTGCLGFVKKAKCPIVPTMLHDTYKVYGVNSLRRVKCSIKYLDPIYYEEYKDLNKKQIAELVKERIAKALAELEDFAEEEETETNDGKLTA